MVPGLDYSAEHVHIHLLLLVNGHVTEPDDALERNRQSGTDDPDPL